MENSGSISFPLERISLDALKLYPKEYQFRMNKAESGEVESHKIQSDHWDPLLHGTPIYVHKRRDEKGAWEFAVVDGHHRVNFAKRLAAEGKLPKDFKLDAYVLEEEKGINTETAKMMLAFKDIAHGDHNPVEAALVLKEAREHPSVRQQFLPSLKLDVGHLNVAVKFSGLSDRALDMVAKGDVPLEAAKLVVEKVPTDHAKQERVFKIISAKLKQDYANYTPNTALASTLAPRANDNEKSWVERIKAQPNTGFSLGA